MIDPELAPYFDAILASPDDDAPRLRLADFLSARGDRRGDAIRVSCAIERLERDDPAREPLEAELRTMPRFVFFDERPPCRLADDHWSRGFADSLRLYPHELAEHGDTMLRLAPVKSVHVFNLPTSAPEIAVCPALARVPELIVGGAPFEEPLLVLCRSLHLSRLRALRIELVHAPLSRTLLETLDREALLPALRVFRVRAAFIPEETWPALVDFAEQRRLEVLDLADDGVRYPAEAHARAHARLGAMLMPAPPPPRDVSPAAVRARVRFGRLDLGGTSLTDAELTTILADRYPDVRRLCLGGTALTCEGICALATSGAFPDLEHLDLDGAGRPRDLALALATARGMDRLRAIDLGAVDDTADDGGPSQADAPIVALARSTRLPALATVTCGRTWRAYTDGQREERVTTRVVRDDGTSAEVIVQHWIWP